MGKLVAKYSKVLLKEMGFFLEDTGGGCLGFIKYLDDTGIDVDNFEMITTEGLDMIEEANETILHTLYKDGHLERVIFQGPFSKWLEWQDKGGATCWLCKENKALYESEACEKCYTLMVNWEEKFHQHFGFEVIMTEELAKELFTQMDIYHEKLRNYP